MLDGLRFEVLRADAGGCTAAGGAERTPRRACPDAGCAARRLRTVALSGAPERLRPRAAAGAVTRPRLRAARPLVRCPSLTLATLLVLPTAPRAARGAPCSVSPSASVFSQRRLLAVREPARVRRDAGGARRRCRAAVLRLSSLFSPGRASAGYAWRGPRAALRGCGQLGACRVLGRSPSGCAAGSSPASPGSPSATAQSPTGPLAGFAPLLGVLRRRLLAAAVAALLALVVPHVRRAHLLCEPAGAAIAARRRGPARGAADHRMDRARAARRSPSACCRATSPQELKFDRAASPRRDARPTPGSRGEPRTLIVLPETALPLFLGERRPSTSRAPAAAPSRATAM